MIRKRTLTTADIEWRGPQPKSAQYGDIYFTSEDDRCIEESNYNFIQQNRLPERFTAFFNSDTTRFAIAELGFGTGLNFFCTADLYLRALHDRTTKHTATLQQLHYLSFEKHPLKQDDFARIGTHFPQFKPLCDEILHQYPIAAEGFHSLQLANGQIHLTLIYGNVVDTIAAINTNLTQIDAWYLDGFAPSQNEAMWCQPVLERVGHLSKPGATLSTFSVAGHIRRGLQQAGFHIDKAPGFGKKREMLIAEKLPRSESTETTNALYRYVDKPWFVRSKQHHNHQDAIVIGGGLSGTAVAHSLATRGLSVKLIERHQQLAQAASGNLAGALFTKLSPHDTAQNRFYQYGYLHAVQHLQAINAQKQQHDSTISTRCGAIQLAYSEPELARQKALTDHNIWPESFAQQLSKEEVQDVSGFRSERPGLYFPRASSVSPAALCAARCNYPNINTVTHTSAIKLIQHGKTWEVINENGETVGSSPIIVIANAQDANCFEQTRFIPLNTIRGQLSYIPSTIESSALRSIICYEGYTLPATEQQHVVGASFNPKSTLTTIDSADHHDNITKLERAMPSLHSALQLHQIDGGEKIKGRVSFRCQTPDYLPAVGPIANLADFELCYEDIRKGALKGLLSAGDYLEGLFISVGHGSRGLTSSSFSAEIICQYLFNEGPKIDRETLEHIHPTRFAIRQLKRHQNRFN